MATFYLYGSVVFLIVGVFSFVSGRRLKRQLRRYEFENRGPGGNIGFKKFEDSERHEKAWKRANGRLKAANTCATLVPIFLVLYFFASRR